MLPVLAMLRNTLLEFAHVLEKVAVLCCTMDNKASAVCAQVPMLHASSSFPVLVLILLRACTSISAVIAACICLTL